MWYLVSLTNPDEKIVLLSGRSYVVGRRDCDIMIAGDQAVSRKHAVLHVAHSEANLGNPGKQPMVRLQDTSKFGTQVNGSKITEEHVLRDGDEIIFGSVSKFLVSCEMLVVTASCLDAASKRQLRRLLLTLGGHVVGEWSQDCSLLVMSAISVTIKVISAMIAQKRIVTPKYFEDLVEFHKAAGPCPNPEDYQPPINEPQLNPDSVSFNPDPSRSHLFQGMLLFFLSGKQFKKLHGCVTMAGATPVLFDEKNDDYSDDMLVAPGSVVMQCPPEELTSASPALRRHQQRVQALLKQKKKFFVQDADIGFAVLHCSTAKHCNPDFDSGELLQLLPSQTLSQSTADVPEPPSVSRKSRGNRTGDASIAEVVDSEGSKVRVKEEVVTPQKTASPRAGTSKQREETGRSVTRESTGASRAETGMRQSDLDVQPAAASSDRPQRSQAVTKASKTAVEELGVKQEPLNREGMDVDVKIEPAETPRKKRSRMEVINLDSDEDDLFPKPKKSRPRNDDDDDDDGNDLFPRRKKPASKPAKDDGSEDDDDLFPKSSKAKGRQVTKTEPGVTERETEEASTSRGRGDPHQQRKERETAWDMPIPERGGGRQAGQSQVEGSGGGVSRAEGRGEDQRERPSNVTPGFLSSRTSIKDQVEKCSRFEPEASVPEETVVVSFTNLVVQTDAEVPAAAAEDADIPQRGSLPEGFILYKGRPVRNFKKFSKSHHAGANTMPEIIGGRDLEVHTSGHRKELEDWFQHAREEESQRQLEERETNELFNFHQAAPRRRR